MEVTAQDRHQLFAWLEEHMGKERATTMELLLEHGRRRRPSPTSLISAVTSSHRSPRFAMSCRRWSSAWT